FSRDWSSDVCSSDLRPFVSLALQDLSEGNWFGKLFTIGRSPSCLLIRQSRRCTTSTGKPTVLLLRGVLCRTWQTSRTGRGWRLRSEERRVGKEWNAG